MTIAPVRRSPFVVRLRADGGLGEPFVRRVTDFEANYVGVLTEKIGPLSVSV
ncbi:hypothetical protein ACFVAJ_04055 [Agromyces sp. NPDC057679]|uniref:hypothetical protein n=1 Tax=Agromyces sp. NPDC057679 TaxID=3346207 RepID=UPI0036722207